MTLAAPFSYYGGKQRIAQTIADLLPEHDHYVEPFAGGLSVLLAKSVSGMETVNDVDADLMTFWRVLRDRPDDLARVCSLTPHSRAEFMNARDLLEGVTDDLERARLVWVIISQGRSGVTKVTGWRHFQKALGSSSSFPRYLSGYVERMHPVAARMMRVSLESRPALDLIADYGKHPEVLLYVDPPYLGSSRKSVGYKHEMPRPDQHRELAEALNGCKAAVVLSGYASPLYDDELYRGWNRIEIDAFTGNGSDRSRGSRTEVVWSNRQIGQASLFDGSPP